MPLVADLMSMPAGAVEVSGSVPMGPKDNAVQAFFLVVNLPSSILTVVLQGSLNGVSWTDLVTWSNLQRGYNAPAPATGVSFPLLRIKATAPVSGIAVFSGGLYTFRA